jgi:pimeloyl-ACP methyl ester carboxylesterase
MGIGIGRSGIALDLGQITAPALSYVGGNDEPEVERKTADALGVELHVLEDLDHLQEFSRLDLVVPLVQDFLESVSL